MDKIGQKEKMKRWKLKEKKDAKTTGGKLVRGSGNRWYNPGDSRTWDYLVESKYTGGKTYSLNRGKLQKLYNEAILTYKVPLLMIQIQDMDLVVMFQEDWEKLQKQKEPTVG